MDKGKESAKLKYIIDMYNSQKKVTEIKSRIKEE